jgi:hypothetical protein
MVRRMAVEIWLSMVVIMESLMARCIWAKTWVFMASIMESCA